MVDEIVDVGAQEVVGCLEYVSAGDDKGYFGCQVGSAVQHKTTFDYRLFD